MKKIIFIDFDGTLLGDDKEISAANIDAITKATQLGYQIVPCSGRNVDSILIKFNDHLKKIINYIIANNGSVIHDLHKNKYIHSRLLDTQSVTDLYNLCTQRSLLFNIYCLDGCYVNADELIKKTRAQGMIPSNAEKFFKNKKVIAAFIRDRDFDKMKALESDILRVPNVQISNRHKGLVDPGFLENNTSRFFYDITTTNISKGSGAKILCEMLNVNIANTIAIGDDTNDVSMLAECGYGVAMGNALPEVKKIAKEITDTNNNDGVAKFLNKLFTKEQK